MQILKRKIYRKKNFKSGIGKLSEVAINDKRDNIKYYQIQLENITAVYGTSLVAQWLRIRLPVQGTRI